MVGRYGTQQELYTRDVGSVATGSGQAIAGANGQASVTISGVAGKQTTVFNVVGSVVGATVSDNSKGLWVSMNGQDVFFTALQSGAPFNLLYELQDQVVGDTVTVNVSAYGPSCYSTVAVSWRQE